jgi:hypothetical protein
MFVCEKDFGGLSVFFHELNILFGHRWRINQNESAAGLQIKPVEIEFFVIIEDVPGVEVVYDLFHGKCSSSFKKGRE